MAPEMRCAACRMLITDPTEPHWCDRHVGGFITKDSGKREEFESGMVRDTQDDKPRYDLVDWPMITRWAALMARGATKYGEHNWKKATGDAEWARFKGSALRHMIQWFLGETDEDHGAAVFFNISGAEMVRAKNSDPAHDCHQGQHFVKEDRNER